MDALSGFARVDRKPLMRYNTYHKISPIFGVEMGRSSSVSVRLLFLITFVLSLVPGVVSALNNGTVGVGLVGWSVVPAAKQEQKREANASASFGLTAADGYGRATVETSGKNDIDAAEIEAYFDLSPGSISSLGNGTARGVAIANTVMTSAGDHLRGNFRFMTNEPAAGEASVGAMQGYDDFAILIADGAVHLLADVNTQEFLRWNAAQDEESGIEGIARATGSISLDFTFNTSGEQKIGFAVFNVTDGGNQSALVIDSLQITDMPTSAVGGLLAASLCWIGYLRFRPLLTWRR
jgi:hypothetical protein